MTVNTRGMDAIIAGLPGAIEQGVERGANLIADLARQLAPEDSGDLKRSIHVDDGDDALSRRVIADMPYAAFVEYGTSNPNYPAQPYMTPAKEQINVETEVAAEVRKLIANAR